MNDDPVTTATSPAGPAASPPPPSPSPSLPPPAKPKYSWGRRISSTALLFAAIGAALALGGGLLSYIGLLTPLAGFRLLFPAVYVAFAALVIAVIALVFHFTRRSASLPRIGAALLLCLPLLGYAGWFMGQARSVPPIHDVTTDLANPPQFVTLTLRDDLNQVVPDGGDTQLAALSPDERRIALHRAAYADLRPIRVKADVAGAVTAIAAQARARGWDVAAEEVDADSGVGRVEATERVSLYRFADDIVFRVVADPVDPTRAIVDARSVSRVGISDVGVNARRIRQALGELSAGLAGE